MSSVTGLDSDYGMQSLAIAVNKKSTDAQAQAALSLLQGAAQSAQQIQAAAPSASSVTGALGANINIHV